MLYLSSASLIRQTLLLAIYDFIQNNGDVKIVVGDNFDEIVLDESKDVLLEVKICINGHPQIPFSLICSCSFDSLFMLWTIDLCTMVRALPSNRAYLQQACQASTRH